MTDLWWLIVVPFYLVGWGIAVAYEEEW